MQRVTRMSCYKQLSANMITRRIKRSSLIFDVQDSRLAPPRYTKEAEHVENNVIILVKKYSVQLQRPTLVRNAVFMAGMKNHM